MHLPFAYLNTFKHESYLQNILRFLAVEEKKFESKVKSEDGEFF